MKKLESSLKNMVLVLSAVTAISVAILAYTNELTKEPIAQAQANILKTAIGEVIPSFDNDPIADKVEFSLDGEVINIYPASKSGKFVGSAVEAKAPGYGGDITILVGFDTASKVYGYSILSHAETPGLGSKVADWFQKSGKGNIIGLIPSADSFKVSKDGGEVDAITASTITSRAFIRAVKKAYQAYLGNDNHDATSGATVVSKQEKE